VKKQGSLHRGLRTKNKVRTNKERVKQLKVEGESVVGGWWLLSLKALAAAAADS
jgi:hypothetical protein